MRITGSVNGGATSTTKTSIGRGSIRYKLTGRLDGRRSLDTDYDGLEHGLSPREMGRIRRDVDRGYRAWVARRRAAGLSVPREELTLDLTRP